MASTDGEASSPTPPVEVPNFSKLAGDDNVMAVRQWLNSGGNVNAFSKADYLEGFPLYMACKPYYHFKSNDKTGVVETLLNAGANPNELNHNVAKSTHEAALHLAVSEANPKLVQVLLELGRADPNVRDRRGETPLHRAHGRRRDQTDAFEAVVKLLLDYGADVHVTDNQGRTPLQIAVMRCAPTIMQLLIAAGADTNIKTRRNDETLLHIVGQQTDFWFKRESDHLIMVSCLKQLLECNLDVNAPDCHGRTPLFHKHVFASLPAQEVLLQAGLDNEIQDNHGRTALSFAMEHHQGSIIACAVAALNRSGANFNTQDLNGWTPLHAALKGDISSLRVLLAHGADRTLRDSCGKTPLDVALQNSRPKTATILTQDNWMLWQEPGATQA